MRLAELIPETLLRAQLDHVRGLHFQEKRADLARGQPVLRPTSRSSLIGSLFPGGVPQLWVPTLVFYDEAGRIDQERQLAHLAFMAPYIKGILVPGSTGPGPMTSISLVLLFQTAGTCHVAPRAVVSLP